MRRITLQVKERTHMLLKLLAVFEDKHLNEITEEALEEFISSRSEELKSLLEISKDRLAIGVMGFAVSLLSPYNLHFTNNEQTYQELELNQALVKEVRINSIPMDNIRLIGDPIIDGKETLSRLNLHKGI